MLECVYPFYFIQKDKGDSEGLLRVLLYDIPNKQFVKLSYSPSSDSSVCAHLPEWLRIEAGNRVC